MMNKPTLNVLGRKHNIVSVEVETEPGVTQCYYDGIFYEYMPEGKKLDLSTLIENPNIQQQFIQRLEKTIDESVEYLINLKIQIADNVIANKNVPFIDARVNNLIEEIACHASYIEALEHCLDIATGKVNVEIEVPSTDE